MPAVAAETVVHVDTTVSETVSINSEDWRAYAINLSSSDSVWISVTVTFGETIDVYSTDVGGFADYANHTATQFTYYRSGSAQGVSSFSATLTAPATGTYYIVIDNAPISTDGAPGSTPVTVRVVLEKSSFPWPLVAGIVATVAGIVVVGIVLVVRAVRRRRKDASHPEEPRDVPGPARPDQPPEEPPPPPGEPPTFP